MSVPAAGAMLHVRRLGEGERTALPDASGSLRSRGTVRGMREAPRVRATFEGSRLRLGNNSLSRARGRADLGLSTTSLQWVVSAYVLGYGGFVLLGGRAADLLGRRRMFLFWLVVSLTFVLVRLAPGIARAVRPGGHVILSGLLSHQARQVAAAYRAQGLLPARKGVLDNWVTLTLRRGPG